MKNTTLLLFAASLLLLTACADTEVGSRTITGQALDFGTKAPIYLGRVEYSQTYNGKTKTYGPVPVDNAGNFTLVCPDALVNSNGVIKVYDSHSNVPYHFSTNMKGQAVVNYTALVRNPSAYYCTFINATPFDAHDSLFGIYFERNWGNQYFYPERAIMGNSLTPESPSASYYGYTDNVIHYGVKKNGNTLFFTDTLRAPFPYANWVLRDTIYY